MNSEAVLLLKEAQERAEHAAMERYFERLRVEDAERYPLERGRYMRERIRRYHSELNSQGIDPSSQLDGLADALARARMRAQ